MESVRQVVLVAAVVALSGCASTDRLSAGYLSAKRAVGLDLAAARPVTQVSLIMQRRLRDLPDPTKPGGDAKQWGLPGQVFLAGADGRPVEAAGDLTVTVTDDTPRPPGQAPRTTEKWHFTKEVLAMLRQKDERFGDCYVLFLPWPADWSDVTKVTVRGQYQAAGQVAMYAQDVPITLDTGVQLTQPQWQKTEPFAVPKFDGQPAVASPPPAAREPIPLPQRGIHPGAPPELPNPSPGGTAVPAGPPQAIVIPRGG